MLGRMSLVLFGYLATITAGLSIEPEVYPVCPALRCSPYCETQVMHDANGCPTCTCCPVYDCAQDYCPYGSHVDENGCPACCIEDPCQGECFDNEVCVVEIVYCIQAPCPPHASCQTQAERCERATEPNFPDSPCAHTDCGAGYECKEDVNGDSICCKPKPDPCDSATDPDWNGPDLSPCAYTDCFPPKVCKEDLNGYSICCLPEVDCSLTADVGFCDGHDPRYFYNAESMQCEQFIWGGCGGNTNNFETEKACWEACDSKAEPHPGGGGVIGASDAYIVA